MKAFLIYCPESYSSASFAFTVFAETEQEAFARIVEVLNVEEQSEAKLHEKQPGPDRWHATGRELKCTGYRCRRDGGWQETEVYTCDFSVEEIDVVPGGVILATDYYGPTLDWNAP